MLARARGGHTGGELAIYIKLKWFKTNPCHCNSKANIEFMVPYSQRYLVLG